MIRYELKWYVPALADWLKVDTYRTEEAARSGLCFFRRQMQQHWQGELKTSIVKVMEEEVK